MEENKSKVYIKVDEQGRVTRCEGGYTTPNDLAGWIYIDEGLGDRYNLCQSHYFASGLYTQDGIHRYVYADGAVKARMVAELDADRAARPAPEPSETERLRADMDFLAIMTGVEL